jgi:hypothetical protein
MSYPPAYDRVNFRGYTLDQMTRQAIIDVEHKLGVTLTLFQGSYNAGKVSASAGTHDGGGAVDVKASAPGKSADQIVRAMRSVGFAAWHRLPSQGPWGEHIHAILIGNGRLSSSAENQVRAYRNGRDGLAANRPDPTWRPSPILPYVYPPQFTRGKNVDHAIGDTRADIRASASKPRRLTKLRAALDALRSIKPRRKP